MIGFEYNGKFMGTHIYITQLLSVNLIDMLLAFSQEGSNQERGLYARCFEELIDLANSDSTSTSQFSFSVSVFELYNEQVLPFFSVSCLNIFGFRLLVKHDNVMGTEDHF